MTQPHHASHDNNRPSFRAAFGNRKMQILLGSLAALAAAGATTAIVQHGTPAAETAPVANRQQIEQIVRDYILDHPEIIPQAMERLQAQRVGSVIDSRRQEIETPYAGAWEGAKDGDVVLVEFFDYACGYCRATLPDIAKLVAGDSKLKVVYREMPILSQQSGDAAKVSLLAADEGKYMEFHKALYAAGRVTRESITAAASSVGIDRQAVDKALANSRYNGEIENNIRLAQALGASGTPTFVIGNKVLDGAVGYDALKAAVAEARVKK